MCGVAVCNSFPNDVVKLNQESNKIAFLQWCNYLKLYSIT
jgi:hypothetical protein